MRTPKMTRRGLVALGGALVAGCSMPARLAAASRRLPSMKKSPY